MQVRNINSSDIDTLKRIHELYFKNEFDFPDFLNGWLCSFLVENEDGRIISAGGVRCITESVLITDKSFSVRERKEALMEMLRASIYTSHKFNFDQLHAFIQNDNWYNHLLKVGFKPTKGKSMVLEIK